ncbi:MAG: hypothetical protein WKF84_02450 [Pyrinomonadaceae bacterium]
MNALQLVGNVRGTGTDFRWLGELRAAAARQGSSSIAGLILSDVAAEISDSGESINVTAGRVAAASLSVPDARVSGLSVSRRAG